MCFWNKLSIQIYHKLPVYLFKTLQKLTLRQNPFIFKPIHANKEAHLYIHMFYTCKPYTLQNMNVVQPSLRKQGTHDIKYTCRAGILPQKEKGFQQIYSCKCMHTWKNIGNMSGHQGCWGLNCSCYSGHHITCPVRGRPGSEVRDREVLRKHMNSVKPYFTSFLSISF